MNVNPESHLRSVQRAVSKLETARAGYERARLGVEKHRAALAKSEERLERNNKIFEDLMGSLEWAMSHPAVKAQVEEGLMESFETIRDRVGSLDTVSEPVDEDDNTDEDVEDEPLEF